MKTLLLVVLSSLLSFLVGVQAIQHEEPRNTPKDEASDRKMAKRTGSNHENRVCKPHNSLGLLKRAEGDPVGDGGADGGGVGVGVNLPSVGLSLGNITTKLGNINLTVTNVTIALGNVEVENVSIGNITIIVSVPLPGASPIQAFSAFTSATSISSSTASPTSTVSSTSASQTATTINQLIARQESSSSESSTTTSTPTGSDSPSSSNPLPPATATVGGDPINLNTGSVNTEIGNISIFVGHVNVSVGDVKIKNITLGNIFVLVQIGQPDITGALGNLTGSLNGIGQ